MKRVLQTFVVFLSILASIVSEHGTHNAVRTPCDDDNGGCSSTCLLSTNELGYSCACPPGIPLLSDKKTCAHEGHSFFVVADWKNILKISLHYFSKYTVEELQLDGILEVFDVDFDPLEGKIYWIQSRVIRRAYLNGTGQQDIISSNLSLPSGIAVDYIARQLYWTDTYNHRIEMSDLNGTNRKVIMRDETAGPGAIVVDTRSKRIYWTDSIEHRIESSSLDGTSRSVVVNTHEHPGSLALDDERKILYWGYRTIKKIEMANVDGSDRRVLISNDISKIYGLSLLGDYIYWTSYDKKMIERADRKTGGNRQVIVDNLHHPSRFKSIILRNITVRTPCDDDNGGCSSTCLLSTNELGYSCACPPGIPLLSDKKTCAHEGHSFFVVADWKNILKISLHYFSKYTVEELQLDGILEVFDVDFDPLEGKIYWIQSRVIRRAYLNGTGQQDIISSNLSLPSGIAVDYIARQLYWTDTYNHRIEMSDLNGTNRKVIMRDETAGPGAIVVDTRSKRIYWTDSIEHRIESSSLDGTSRSVVVNTHEHPGSLALDDERKILYWGYRTIKKIEMANVDGSDRRVLISNDISKIYGLSLLGDYIYWTSYDKKMIERADRKTGGNRQVIVDNLHHPSRLKSIILRNITDKSVKDCRLDLKGKDDLTAVHRNHTFEGQEMDFLHRSTIKFSCKSFYTTLEGAKNVTCIHGQWSKEIPTCKQTSGFDFLHPPFLGVYFANFNRINTDDGRVMIPKETLFKIVCWSPEKRQLSLHERNSAGKQLLKVNISSEDMFSSVKVINPVREKTEATVQCINSKGIFTEFNVVIADTCEVDENELNRRGLQIVPDSRQRIYVEGDKIQVECSSNEQRTDQFIIICISGPEWEYANNMVC